MINLNTPVRQVTFLSHHTFSPSDFLSAALRAASLRKARIASDFAHRQAKYLGSLAALLSPKCSGLGELRWAG